MTLKAQVPQYSHYSPQELPKISGSSIYSQGSIWNCVKQIKRSCGELCKWSTATPTNQDEPVLTTVQRGKAPSYDWGTLSPRASAPSSLLTFSAANGQNIFQSRDQTRTQNSTEYVKPTRLKMTVFISPNAFIVSFRPLQTILLFSPFLS